MTYKFTLKMKPRRNLYDFIRYTQRFLRGQWRTEEEVYINKEQRWGGVGGDVNVP